MTWVKLDDQFPDHPKLAELGELTPAAGWLHVCALCYSARYLTDGRIPGGQVPRLMASDTKPLVEVLLEVGLWERDGTGYQIHDYLDYNPSRAQVLAEREAKKAGGRRGGKAAARARAEAAPQGYAQGQPQASAQAYASGESAARGQAPIPPSDNSVAAAKPKSEPPPSRPDEAQVTTKREPCDMQGLEAYPQAEPTAYPQAYARGGACPQLEEVPQAESNSRTRTPSPCKEDAAAVARAREAAADGERSSSIGKEERKGPDLEPPPPPPDPTDDDDPTDALLIELWDVPGWQRKPAADRKELLRLRCEYPRANLATAIMQLRAKARDGTLKAGPAAALLAFVKRLHEQTVPEVRRVAQAAASDDPDAEAPSQEEQAALARAAGEAVRQMRAGAS